MDDRLFDVETILLERFKKYKKRTPSEVEKFIKILIALREQPGENPQLKGAKLK